MEKIRIIVADEQSLFLKGLRLIIDNFGTIELFGDTTDSQRVLHLINEVQPDVLLLSQTMLASNGTSIIREIRSINQELKILMLNVYNDVNAIQRGIEAGANGFLLKNVEPSTLKKAIETVVNEGCFFSKDMLTTISSSQQLTPSTSMTDINSLHLTQREIDILKFICQGHTTAEIASQLYVSSRTVEGHRQNLLSKIGAKNSAGLIIFAIKNKLVEV